MSKESLSDLVQNSNLEELKRRLLEPNCDVNGDKNSSSASPLIWAAYQGKEEFVKVLLDAGADTSLVNSLTAKEYAKKEGHQNIVLLIEAEEVRRESGWKKFDDENILNTEHLVVLNQKITRIFNLRAMTMKETTQNLATKAESTVLLHFSDPAVDRRLIKKAQLNFLEQGGDLENISKLSEMLGVRMTRTLRKVTV